jgi:hypothetical protein
MTTNWMAAAIATTLCTYAALYFAAIKLFC